MSVSRRRFLGLAAGGSLVGLGVTAGAFSSLGWRLEGWSLIPPAGSSGGRVFVADDGRVYVDGSARGLMAQSADDSHLFAPMPLDTSVYSGSLAPLEFNEQVAASMPLNSWIVPEVADFRYRMISSDFVSARFDDGIPHSLFGASRGVLSSLSQPLSTSEGSTVIAGHVNEGDTGYLSAWGYLHRCGPGMRVFVKDSGGSIAQWVVRRVYVLRQGSDFSENQRVWAKTGERLLNLVTCAGAYVGADGSSSGTFLFPYTHNLVVECVPAG